jgi:hypothetical protein
MGHPRTIRDKTPWAWKCRSAELTKSWLFIFLGFAQVTNQPTIHTNTGTLILIGATNTSIVIATDSLATHTLTKERTERTDKKIIPVGNGAVCFMVGDSSHRWMQNGKTVDEVDFIGTVEDWSKKDTNEKVYDA